MTGIEVADLVTNGSAVAAVTVSSLVENSSSHGNGDHIMASCEIGECPYGLHNDMQVRYHQDLEQGVIVHNHYWQLYFDRLDRIDVLGEIGGIESKGL